MKTIAPAAMAAIEAGEAIVTGAVEIMPLSRVNYTTVDVVDLDAVDNAATTAAGGLLVGVELDGFDPTDIVRVSLPTGQTYVAWSPWGIPAKTVAFTGSYAWFNVIPDGVAGDMFQFGDRHPDPSYDGYEAARASMGVHTFSGASAYTFYIDDDPIGDNSGGLSILVERGVAVGSADALRVWGGYGPITFDGDTYDGLGNSAVAQQTAGAIGGVAQGLTLGLSGIEPALLELMDDADQYKTASVVIYRLIFASDAKTLLDAHVFDRGRIDGITSEEVIGGAASLMAAVESAARGLGRSGARMRSDSDQRLIDPTDGYFKSTAFAGSKSLYWGGKRPARTSSALGGSSGSGSAFVDAFRRLS